MKTTNVQMFRAIGVLGLSATRSATWIKYLRSYITDMLYGSSRRATETALERVAGIGTNLLYD